MAEDYTLFTIHTQITDILRVAEERGVVLPPEQTKMTHLCLRLYYSYRTLRMLHDTHTYELLTNGVAIVTVPHTAAPSGGHLSRAKRMHWRPAQNTWWQETEQHVNHKSYRNL